MIIGSGLLAQAFSTAFGQSEAVCIYSAGVSNSGCNDLREFEREMRRLTGVLQHAKFVDAFIYFGTCSTADPETCGSYYVQHKLAMEQLVAAHPRHLILRLPQVVGISPNPHTLLNYLYSRISRSESFRLWQGARRYVIDVDDVVSIARQLVAEQSLRNTIINVASTKSYSMGDIVNAMESAVGKRAIYEVVACGSGYLIDTSVIHPFLDKAGVRFDHGYLERLINKYYAKSN